MSEADGKTQTVRDRLVLAVASGFGLGYCPVAPGTAGTLLGVALALAVAQVPGRVWRVLIAAALAAVAVPVCDAAERRLGRKDDRRIVADEYLTFPICVIGLPLEYWLIPFAFLSNRFLDIVKPPPARQFQRLRGGVGIVMDDVAACLYGLAVNWAFYCLVSRLFLGG
ncbi:MAG: phosphatidylglycerophosphatase A [Kiritimatiellae bacterium]|nr:phosphatidylglycerophosphatase A [Kiritimatiellia bacterium]